MSRKENPVHAANAWMNDPVQVAVVRQTQEDYDWAMARYAELEKQFHGQSIAVRHKQIVAHGKDDADIVRQTTAAGIPTAELVILEFPNLIETPPDLF